MIKTENKKEIIDTVIERIHNLFPDIEFNEWIRKNVLKSTGQRLESVSSKYKLFEIPFDKKIAKYVAKKLGITEEEVLAMWDAKAKASTDAGKEAHTFSEDYIKSERKLLPLTDHQKGIVEFFQDHPNYIVLAQELTIYNKTLLYMGILDLLVYDIENDKFIIVDWKTNDDIYKNHKKQKLLEPFTDMLQCPANLYKIQLNLYDMCFEDVEFPIEGRLIVWLKKNEETEKYYQIIEAEDLKPKLKEYYVSNSRTYL